MPNNEEVIITDTDIITENYDPNVKATILEENKSNKNGPKPAYLK